MRRLRVASRIIVTAVIGCAAFVALLPWGDPCSLTTPPGVAGCEVLFSPLQQNMRNAGFGGVCLMIGFIGGLFTRSHRLLAGALGTLLALIFAHFAVHWVYGLGWPQHPMPWTSTRVLGTAEYLGASAAVGPVGGLLCGYVRVTHACSGRDA